MFQWSLTAVSKFFIKVSFQNKWDDFLTIIGATIPDLAKI